MSRLGPSAIGAESIVGRRRAGAGADWQRTRLGSTIEVLDSEARMCRNIKTLFNFEPPATEEEIKASSLQFVRKLSGFTHPSRANEAAFNRAVEEVAAAA